MIQYFITKFRLEREEAKFESQKMERKAKQDERRAERKGRLDEIRRKYGRIKKKNVNATHFFKLQNYSFL